MTKRQAKHNARVIAAIVLEDYRDTGCLENRMDARRILESGGDRRRIRDAFNEIIQECGRSHQPESEREIT